MHPLLARLAGKPALSNWRFHVLASRKAVEKYTTAAGPARTLQVRIAAARKSLYDSPSPEKTQELINLLTQEPHAAAVENALSVQGSAKAQELIASPAGREKFDLACAEVVAALEATRAEIIAQDSKRSAELGEEVSSPGPILTITRKIEQLAESRMRRRTDFSGAVTALQTITGES